MRDLRVTGSSTDHVGQAVELAQVGHGGEQHQLIATGILIPSDELGNGLGGSEQTSGYFLGEGSGEGVIVPQIGSAGLGRSTKREVRLPPEAGLARASSISPGSPGLVSSPGKGPGRTTSMHIAVGVASHPGEDLVTQSSHQQLRTIGLSRLGTYGFVFPVRA